MRTFLIIAALVIGITLLNKKRVMSELSKIRLSKNFTLDEFVVTSTGIENIPNEKEVANLRQLTLSVLQPLRDYFNKAIIITSGFRNSLVNAAIGGAANSQHLYGEAVDFHIVGVTNQQIIDVAYSLNLPFDQIIDEQLRGKKWVHVSYRKNNNRRQWLTARDGSTGKTIYSTIKQG